MKNKRLPRKLKKYMRYGVIYDVNSCPVNCGFTLNPLEVMDIYDATGKLFWDSSPTEDGVKVYPPRIIYTKKTRVKIIDTMGSDIKYNFE